MIAINQSGIHTMVWNSSANMVIGTAFIMDLAVDKLVANSASTNEFVSNTAQIKNGIITNAKIANLDAGKITTGTLGVARTAAKCTDPNADQTSVNTAANISGQGSLATRNNVEWATHIASIPARLNSGDTPTADGVYITPNFIGFWDQGTTTWTVRIKNNSGTGEFYVGDGSNKFVAWDGTDLTVQGKIQTAASGQRMVLDNSDNTFNMYSSGGTKVIVMDDDSTYAQSPSIQMNSTYGGVLTASAGGGSDGVLIMSVPSYGVNPAMTWLMVTSPASHSSYPSIMTAWDTSAGGSTTAFGVLCTSVGGGSTTYADIKVFTAGKDGVWVRGNVEATGYVDADGGFKDNGTAGIDTTFLDADGNTITVSGGIITAITAP
jgi:hypothetical protein